MSVTPETRMAVLKDRLPRGRGECYGRVVFARPLSLPNGEAALSATLGYRETKVTDPTDRAIGYVDSGLFRMDFLPSPHLNSTEKARLMVLNASINLEDGFDLKYVYFQYPDPNVPGGIREESVVSAKECGKTGKPFDPIAYLSATSFLDEVLETLTRETIIESYRPDRRSR